VQDHAPRIRGLILGAPAFRVKLYIPLSVGLLRRRQKLFDYGYVKSYVKANVLRYDSAQAQFSSPQPRPSIITRPEVVEALLEFESRIGMQPASNDRDYKSGLL